MKSKVIPFPTEQPPLETAILGCYSTDSLQIIYGRYLKSLFQASDFKERGSFSVGKLAKRHVAWAIGQTFSQKELFEKLLSILPPGVLQVLNRLTWHKGEHPIESFTEPLDPPFFIETVETWNGKLISKETINPCYAIIPAKKNYSYRSFYDYHSILLYLPDLVRDQLKQLLPPPEGYHLKGMDTIDKTDFLYEDGSQTLHQLHLICTYIGQGSLKYSKNGEKILKTSAREMAANCHIQEFFVEKNPDMEHLKTTLIVDFLKNQSIKETQAAPEFLKQIFDQFFKKLPDSWDFHLNRLLFHIKGIHNLQSGYHEQIRQRNEHNVRVSLQNLLRALQPGLWYSVQKLLEYCFFREIDLEIVDRSFASRYLTVDIRHDDGHRGYGDSYRIAEISTPIYQQALVEPLFKGFMFLLAAFGIVDIAFNFPKNSSIQKNEKDYLSVFDGLQYIRLTPLGAYIVGLARKYAFKSEIESANLVLDDKRLLITLDRTDQLKAITLGQLAEKVSETCYKVTCGSFLKSCATQKDIETKIGLFRKQVSAKPPRIWENFLNDILNKIDPLTPEPDLLVFRLKEHPELIELMAMDDILKKNILKAEDYHVIISAPNLNKVKKRLEAFGYFNHPLK